MGELLGAELSISDFLDGLQATCHALGLDGEMEGLEGLKLEAAHGTLDGDALGVAVGEFCRRLQECVRDPAPVEDAEGEPIRFVLDGLEAWLARALGRSAAKYGTAMACRLGFGVTSRYTLAQAGALVGVTRERVRQVEAQMLERLPASDPPTDLLEMVVERVAAMTPVDIAEAQARLAGDAHLGLTVDVTSFLNLCRDLSITDVPEVVGCTIGKIPSEMKRREELSRTVLQGWLEFDVRHIAQIEVAVAADLGPVDLGTVDRADVLDVLERQDDITPLGGDWYLRAPHPLTIANRKWFPVIVSTIIATLSICGLLSAEVLRRGVIRRAKRHNLPYPPSEPFRRLLGELGLLCAGTDSAELPAGHPANQPGAGDRAIIEAIRASSAGHISNAALRGAVVAAGLRKGYAAQATGFSPYLMRCGRDRWTIRTGLVPEIGGRSGDDLMSVDQEIAAKFRQTRRRLNLSQRAFGELLGTNQPAVSNYERGRLRIPDSIAAQIRKIATDDGHGPLCTPETQESAAMNPASSRARRSSPTGTPFDHLGSPSPASLAFHPQA